MREFSILFFTPEFLSTNHKQDSWKGTGKEPGRTGYSFVSFVEKGAFIIDVMGSGIARIAPRSSVHRYVSDWRNKFDSSLDNRHPVYLRRVVSQHRKDSVNQCYFVRLSCARTILVSQENVSYFVLDTPISRIIRISPVKHRYVPRQSLVCFGTVCLHAVA